MAERSIGDMHIRDVHRLIIENAATIGADRPLTELLQKIIADPRSRHVYVVDEEGTLIGSVRLNAIVKQLFPMTTAASSGEYRTLEILATYDAKTVSDLMNESPVFVQEETTVNEAVQLMVAEGVNELPVVDEKRRVTGEINFLEVIAAYLKAKRNT